MKTRDIKGPESLTLRSLIISAMVANLNVALIAGLAFNKSLGRIHVRF